MKNKILIRMIKVLLAALMMMGGFSVTAYAGGGPETEEELPEETTPTETEEPKEPVALTPEGDLTLVDDIDGEVSEDKQFITVVTKSGNYFYIIVDRAAEGENTVHFLNQVDEADLMALIEDDNAAGSRAYTRARTRSRTGARAGERQRHGRGAGGYCHSCTGRRRSLLLF